MLRLTWRQFRTQAAVAFGAVAAVAVVLAITGPRVVNFYDALVAPCAVHADCGVATSAFLNKYHFLQGALNAVVLVLPALIGIFWGAPLVARELEAGTYRLAWTQTVTRWRWLGVKVGVLGLSSLALAGVFSLMVTWWSSPFDRVNANRFTPAMFGERGITPVGYAALAFALGLSAGVVIRRTLPAMAATLAAFIGARLAATYWVRPNLSAPLRAVSGFQLDSGTGGLPHSGDWVISSQTINAAGKVIGDNGGIGPSGNVGFDVGRDGAITFQGVGLCPNKVPASAVGNPSPSSVQAAFQECAHKLGIREILHYQPAGRYWALQWYETAIFVGLALMLVGFSFWWIRGRRRPGLPG
ncbi:MAG TPA: hypothetical protein VHU85_03590 [Acidimicrobiales bacterium]|jgi:hypothetical protein|nr:hypothetical protein [Acidimicrobiales bacterium]